MVEQLGTKEAEAMMAIDVWCEHEAFGYHQENPPALARGNWL
jgi:hypothetical protein